MPGGSQSIPYHVPKLTRIPSFDHFLCLDREYLTGFHKRKVHRQNVARELAKQKEHEEKLEARKEARAARKEMQEEKVQEYEKYRRRKSFSYLFFFFCPC